MQVSKIDTNYTVRYIEKDILSRLEPNKVVVIHGPRRVGKTTLMRHIQNKLNEPSLWLEGENLSMKEKLSSQRLESLMDLIGENRLIFIDEAQQVENIGLNLKILVDQVPGIRLVVSGSSSFELSKQVGEPLVGRKWQYYLYPLSQLEIGRNQTVFESDQLLEERLIFGSYPEVVYATDRKKKSAILESIVDGVLFKDVFALEGVKKPQKIVALVRLLALQIGKQVSLTELSNALDINLATVERYLDLLEKTFVISRVYGFSRNLRKEITKTCRYYFWDNGIRNALINNFNSLNIRDDVGMLWENYLFIERQKKRLYKQIFGDSYFWRTHDRQEIDLVEDRGGVLYGYEFKWSEKKISTPQIWRVTYPEAKFEVINKKNYLSFIV